jgi:hypothetical protein
MHRPGDVVAGLVALSVACASCSSTSFDVADAADVSPVVDASDDSTIDAAADTAEDVTADTSSMDSATRADAPIDAIGADCPPRLPCSSTACAPLMMRDLEAINVTGAPGFDAAGFRCKTLTVCGAEMSCIYYDVPNMFGNVQSQEPKFYDGSVSAVAVVATKLRLGGGAKSECGNPPVTLNDGDIVRLTFDGGKTACVFLPAFTGTELTLYIAADGSTFYDRAFTMHAKKRP